MEKNLFLKDYSVGLPYIDKASRRDWVSFGYRNNFTDELLFLANNSPIQKSILDSKLTYCMGGGLIKLETVVLQPNITDSWDDLVYKCMSDFVTFEAFAVQAILNQDGKTFSFYHQPIDQVRLGQYNSRNQIEKAYLCTNWNKAYKDSVVEIPMFGVGEIKKGQPYLMYFKRYRAGEYYYAIPQWYSAANWILADSALSKYYVNYINNNFSANLSISYPYELDENKKQELYELLKKSFGGSENAGNILLLFGENGVLPEVKPIESVNADLYNSVADMVLKYIVSANRLTSPTLVGLATSSGFSSKSDEIIAAYNLYMLTVIQEIRTFVLDKLNNLLNLNGYKRLLTIQDFNIREEFEGNTDENDVIEDESIDVKSDEEQEDNVVDDENNDDKNAENNEEVE